MQKSLSIHLVLVLKTSHWYRFLLFYLSISPGCGKNDSVFFMDEPAAHQQGMLGALIVWWPTSFWLQWTMAEGTVHGCSPAKFSTKPTEELKKEMYAIKQIKICPEYRDMLPRPRLDLSGTHGPGSWQTSLGLGSMFWYSAQILICITQALRPCQLNPKHSRIQEFTCGLYIGFSVWYGQEYCNTFIFLVSKFPFWLNAPITISHWVILDIWFVDIHHSLNFLSSYLHKPFDMNVDLAKLEMWIQAPAEMLL